MGFFDLFTSKPSKEDIANEKARAAEAKLKHSEKLNMELQAALEVEANKEAKHKAKNQAQAVEHLRIAERYEEMSLMVNGARKSEFRAIVERRIENAANLGVKVKGTITETINRYS